LIASLACGNGAPSEVILGSLHIGQYIPYTWN